MSSSQIQNISIYIPRVFKNISEERMKNIFEIVKVVGLGLIESPNVEYSTGLLFFDKNEADNEANKLWKEHTTEEERKSGWCGLHFIVKTREVK